MPRQKKPSKTSLPKQLVLSKNLSREQVRSFVRTHEIGVISKSAGDAGHGFWFKLSNLPGYLEFTNLFDHYRITGVTLMFVNFMNTANIYPTLFVCGDQDDAGVPAALNELLEISTTEILPFSANRNTYERRIQPRFNVPTVAGATFTSNPTSWLDCAYPDVTHYGVKVWITDYNSSYHAGTGIRVYARYEVECKSIR